MTMIEVNFDGLIGPSHNYAGLSLGNLAACFQYAGNDFIRFLAKP
mgnify:CR=1 FL=1